MKCKVCGKEFHGIGDTCASCTVKTTEDLIKNTTSGKVAVGLFAIVNPCATLGAYAASKAIKKYSEKEKEEEGTVVNQQMQTEQDKRFNKICKEYDNEFISNFLTLPYNERNLLVPVKEYSGLSQENISVIDIKKMNLIGIDFDLGHPKAYHLYIGHPSIPQRYIPFEGYELEFLVDKIHDFCHLLLSLGASEISIECINRNTKDNRSHAGLDVSGGLGKTGVASGEVAYHSDKKQHIEERIQSKVGLYQTNTPSKAPYVPEDMHWTDPTWNHIIRDRLYGNGHLNGTRTYTIETSSVRMLDSSDLKSIKAEFESIYVNGKGAWSKEQDKSFALSENSTLSIKVTFAPFEELTGY